MHATSAIRGVREWRETGSTGRSGKAATCGRGGLKPIATLSSVRIEEQVDITRVELAEMLRSQHGAVFAPSTI